ncbi:MAG: hypothetical protein GF350_12940 [Chitinivibrionales bacterium]|nr:hypothetical protein [Chitinivibrionales bacterium]
MKKQTHHKIFSEFARILARHSIAVSDSVLTAIEFFFSEDHHVSTEDVEHFARENNLGISKAEINKAFELLEKFGFATKRVFADGVQRYEHFHIGEHHDHLYCLKCGRIIEFYSSGLEEEQGDVAREHNFHAFSHKMQINGLCSQCFGEPSQEIPLSEVQAGGTFCITRIATRSGRFGGHGFSRRLNDLGLVPGAEGQVINNGRGMVIINCGSARIALRRGQSRKIMVALTN